MISRIRAIRYACLLTYLWSLANGANFRADLQRQHIAGARLRLRLRKGSYAISPNTTLVFCAWFFFPLVRYYMVNHLSKIKYCIQQQRLNDDCRYL